MSISINSIKILLIFIGIAIQLNLSAQSTNEILVREDIRALAKSTIEDFEVYLNEIDNANTQSEKDKLIGDCQNLVFTESATIEDDLNPTNNNSNYIKNSSDYLKSFSMFFVSTSSSNQNIEFSNIVVGDVKNQDYDYVTIYFESLYKGEHKTNKINFSRIGRLATVKYVQGKTKISSIKTCDFTMSQALKTEEAICNERLKQLQVGSISNVIKSEKEVWETAYNNPSIENIRAYLNQYPYGKYRTEANNLLETSYYTKADKADNHSSCEIIPTELAVQYWKEYLQHYPSGIYSAYANERLKNYLLKNEKLSIDQQILMYEEYKTKYTNCASAYDDKVAKLKELSKLISINKKPLILYNILVPGLGNALINRRLVNSGHKPTFKRYFSSLSTLTVWGGMAVAGMYYMQSKDYYKQYTTTKKAAEWDDLLKLSNKKRQTASIWAGAAGAIWALDCLNLVNKQFIVKRKAKKVLESYAFTIVPTPYNTNIMLTLNLR